MKKIPCKQCKSCGKYSSINIPQCRCGADLTDLPGTAVEHNRIPLPQIGRIDKDLTYYVRKCPVCSTEHFFTDAGGSVRRCRNCSKSQIQYQPTVPYEDEDEEEKKAPEQPETRLPVSPLVSGGWGDDDDDEDDDIPGGSTFGSVLKNIQQATGTSSAAGAGPARNTAADDDDEDEDEDDGSDSAGIWGQLLGRKGLSDQASSIRRNRLNTAAEPPKIGTTAQKAPEKPAASTITLTALRYGAMTVTLRSDSPDLPYLVGRSAGCAEFLRQDAQVGNEHCWLDYRNGTWMVKEKRAINGTAINGQFLPEGGSGNLRDGDELMLGHRSDSMAFRVRIR